ncbi:hypothetical protein Tco_0902524 [Tanacetum coccineum]
MADSWKAMDLNREWEKQKRVKYDKRKVAQMKIQDHIKKRIEKAGHHLNKEKQIMHINKGKEKMVMKREVIIIESDTSYDYFLAQATSDEGSDHNPFQATSDHNPFQVTSNESSDDTLKSSSEDTFSSDCTWEQKKLLKVNQGLDLPKRKKLFMVNKGQALKKKKKTTNPSEIVQWYDDLSSDEQRTIYKGRRGSSFRNATITKPEKLKSR